MNSYSKCYDICDWHIIENSKGYRMPTYEEWGYFAKGGEESRNYLYAGSNDASEVGWFSNNSNGCIHQVGLLQPNELGLYDISGNVNEYCTETYKPLIIAANTIKSALASSNRIWRGGSFSSAEVTTNHYTQNINNPDYYLPFSDVGLRIVRNK